MARSSRSIMFITVLALDGAIIRAENTVKVVLHRAPADVLPVRAASAALAAKSEDGRVMHCVER